MGLMKDLLPVVSNPNAVISPNSSVREIGKTPSHYNQDGQVVGFSKWTNHYSTQETVQEWACQSDYGICVHTRNIHAFDVDCDDPDKAAEVTSMVSRAGGIIRYREGSPRTLVVFRPEHPFDPRKLINLGESAERYKNKVEFYGRRKQFVAAGTHPSGERYKWRIG